MAQEGVFVTGTGTEVGKTVVSAVLAREGVERGLRVGVFKPAVSGLEDPGPADHEVLRSAARSAQSDEEISPYRYQPPLSPHLAAELAGEAIAPGRLLAAAASAAGDADLLVCEGVGGLMVPLTERYLVRDLARDLGYPVVIAASPGLGTINHTLLTIEAVRAVDLEVRTVVLTPWPDRPGAMERSNLATIEALGRVSARALPRIDPLEPEVWPEPA